MDRVVLSQFLLVVISCILFVKGGHVNYANAILASDPVFYYRFDETTGTVANDAAENFNGTYVNGPTLNLAGAPVGIPSTAVTFTNIDEGGDYVSSGTLDNFGSNMGEGVSMSLWFRTEDTFNTSQFLLGVYNSGLNTALTLQVARNAGQPNIQLAVRQDGNHSLNARANQAGLATGDWHNLVVTFDDSNEVSMYLNGTSLSVTYTNQNLSPDNSFSNFAFPLAIGAVNLRGDHDSSTFGQFNGQIDHFAVFDRVLTQGEVQGHLAAIPEVPWSAAILLLVPLGIMVRRFCQGRG